MGWVYIHTNKINGKKYIGQTTMEPSKRWSNGKGYNTCTRFYRAIKKYGWDNFEHDAYEMNDLLLDGMESFLIEYYHTTDKDFGYNLASGGNKNKKMSEETKKKMSESKIGNQSALGFHHSEGTKKLLSEKLRGENNPFYGKHHSEEAKKKNTIAHIGKYHSEESKRKMSKSREKYCYTIQSPNGEILKTTNLRGFCRENNINSCNMCSNGKSKGYILLSKEEL